MEDIDVEIDESVVEVETRKGFNSYLVTDYNDPDNVKSRVVEARSEKQAASYYAKVLCGNSKLRHKVAVKMVNREFYWPGRCPKCGYRDAYRIDKIGSCPNCDN